MKRILSIALGILFVTQTAFSSFRYDHFVLQSYAFDYARLKTPQDFVAMVTADLRPDDRKELEKSLKPLKSLPKMKFGGNTLQISYEGHTMTVDLNRAAHKIAVFNGVQIAIDTKAPLAPQFLILKRKLETQGKEVSRMDLLLPKAYAIPPLIVGALGFVALALANKIIDRYGSATLDIIDSQACWLMNDKMKILSEGSAACREYIQRQKELAAKNPEVQAVRDALREVNSNEPIDVAGEVCPHQGDQKTYRSSIQFLNKPDARARIEIKLEGNNVKEFKVLDAATDKVLATYVLKDQTLDKIRLPNPAAKSLANGTQDPLAPAEIEISATTEISDPILSAEQKFHKSIFAKMGQRLGACKAAADNIRARSQRQQQNDGTR